MNYFHFFLFRALILKNSYFHHTFLNYLLLIFNWYSCATDAGWCSIWWSVYPKQVMLNIRYEFQTHCVVFEALSYFVLLGSLVKSITFMVFTIRLHCIYNREKILPLALISITFGIIKTLYILIIILPPLYRTGEKHPFFWLLLKKK